MVSGARSGTHRSGGSGICYSAELFRDGVVDKVFYYDGERSRGDFGDKISCYQCQLFRDGLVDKTLSYDGESSHGDFGDKMFCYTGELFRDGLVDEIFY